jgi:hypothetical protein
MRRLSNLANGQKRRENPTSKNQIFIFTRMTNFIVSSTVKRSTSKYMIDELLPQSTAASQFNLDDGTKERQAYNENVAAVLCSRDPSANHRDSRGGSRHLGRECGRL